VSHKNPLQENEEGSPVYEKWKSFLTGQILNKKGEKIKEPWVKELPKDWAVEAGKNWGGIAPVSEFYHCTTLSRKDSSRHKHYLTPTNDDLPCLLIEHY
jgi:hypothetical protein